MVLLTSGYLRPIRPGGFRAGDAEYPKQPTEEGDWRGVGKGEAATSKWMWMRARPPLLKMEVEIKSSDLIKPFDVHVYS